MTDRPQYPSISIILPAHNEEEVLPLTYRRLADALNATGCPWEVLLIDDGSSDRTVPMWRELMATDGHLGLVAFTRNYGKENALLAGFRHSRGRVVVPVDADLQDPPEVIAEFLVKWREGYDMVYGVRRRRDDPLAKRLAARIHYRLLHATSPIRIPAEAGDFRLLDRTVVEDLLRLPERDRYHKGLYAWVGRRSCPVEYDRPARAAGQARMNFNKLFSLAIDGITSFSEAPLRILLWGGLLACGMAGAYGLYLLTIVLILHQTTPPGYPTLLVFILFFGGIQMVALGMIGEYQARIYREVKQRPAYLIAEQVEAPAFPVAGSPPI